MQENLLKIRHFEKGLSKSLKNVIPKISSANVCKSIHDIINYSTTICPFESGTCGKGQNYKNLNISKTKIEKRFFNEIKSIFHSF